MWNSNFIELFEWFNKIVERSRCRAKIPNDLQLGRANKSLKQKITANNFSQMIQIDLKSSEIVERKVSMFKFSKKTDNHSTLFSQRIC